MESPIQSVSGDKSAQNEKPGHRFQLPDATKHSGRMKRDTIQTPLKIQSAATCGGWDPHLQRLYGSWDPIGL
jgi:hypothetical protein